MLRVGTLMGCGRGCEGPTLKFPARMSWRAGSRCAMASTASSNGECGIEGGSTRVEADRSGVDGSRRVATRERVWATLAVSGGVGVASVDTQGRRERWAREGGARGGVRGGGARSRRCVRTPHSKPNVTGASGERVCPGVLRCVSSVTVEARRTESASDKRAAACALTSGQGLGENRRA